MKDSKMEKYVTGHDKGCYNSPEETDWNREASRSVHETVQTHLMVPRTDAEDNCDEFPAQTWNVSVKDF